MAESSSSPATLKPNPQSNSEPRRGHGRRVFMLETLDNNTPISKLGEGSFGQVFQCRNVKDNTIVAVKQISIKRNFDGVPADIIREVSHLKELKHPNIVRSSAVDYCNTHNVIHLDLKPINLLIDRSKKIIKLTDFGFCKELGDPDMQYSTNIATPWYTTPEMLFGGGRYSTLSNKK
ncbi:cyclin-dependent kinase 5 isoform x2 [Trifolium medium]|uniref:Cyclin-dependent kinase 5 isoform x2 n=1 Tax=Trifolium medium TaxID=97028 RepID=A0A392MJJ0_9FABA|nr:cyclin-dependent kinase 5 isoform x2 [Trifolium medium]